MKYYIFRNSTIEHLFKSTEYSFSGYNEISLIDDKYDMYMWFYLVDIRTKQAGLSTELISYFHKIQLICKQIPVYKSFIIFTLKNLYPKRIQSSNFDTDLAIQQFNNNVNELAAKYPNIKIVDFSTFTNAFPLKDLIDWKYYFMSDIQINPKLSALFYNWFLKQIQAIEYRRKKCLILDLDNTLWGGVLGEDGSEGIKIGGDYPGNAYLMFQENLIELRASGVLLAVCSKNNEADVFELWDSNPFVKLKKEHFSALRINWNNKAQNIKEIAEELNIGLDSLVFVDDNPSERELIRQFLPQVEVPDFPAKPYNLPDLYSFLLQNYFSVYSLTDEDLQKSTQYEANKQRLQAQQGCVDIDSYLQSLEMKIEIEEANQYNIPRIAQMSQKTNQFNLTTKRYTEADIQKLAATKNAVFCIRVVDKFGDYGISGAVILKYPQPDTAQIDSFFMSCRILGKKIETGFLNWILNILKENNIETVRADYFETTKNVQVKNFYFNHGFTVLEENLSEIKYRLQLSKTTFQIPSFYKIVYNGE